MHMWADAHTHSYVSTRKGCLLELLKNYLKKNKTPDFLAYN
jgi:hypothetical protein